MVNALKKSTAKEKREATALDIAGRQLSRMAKALIDAKIELAKRDGYIQRVHETESAAKSGDDAPLTDGVEKLRTILQYSTSKEADQIIDVLSPDLIDQILGKPRETAWVDKSAVD